MPAQRKPSPSSPATDQPPRTDPQPSARSPTRAEALRWWQAGYQAGHQAAEHKQQAAAQWDRLAGSFRAQHAADQQASINALLLDIIDALASLFDNPSPEPATASPATTCQNMHIKRCQTMCRQRGR